MGKGQRKHHIHESQEVSPFPTGDHKAERNIHDDMAKTNINNKQKNTKETQKKIVG